MKFKNTFNKITGEKMVEELAQTKKNSNNCRFRYSFWSGMQADLATFAANGLYGFCALTSIVTVKEDKFLFTL